MNSLRRLALAVPTAVLACAACASPSSASTGLFADGINLLLSGDGQGNVVSVDPLTVQPTAQLRVTDVSQPLVLIAGCSLQAGFNNRADCIPVQHIGALLGGGNDTLTIDANLPVEAYGQLGKDTITGGDTGDKLEGNGGDDVVQGDGGDDWVSDGNRSDGATGIGGDDVLDGGPGNDVIDGGPLPGGGAGADTLDGKTGIDTIDYSARTAPLTVTEGVGADDGEAGEGDNVVNGEIILGGSGNDSLTGAGEPNTLRGGRGDDTLDGGPGTMPDVLEGGFGTDTASYATHVTPVTANLDGETGDGAPGENDTVGYDIENLRGGYESDALTGSSGANALSGGPGDDMLDGLGGDDTLVGDGGADKLNGASGDDTITGGDGADTITCGTGDDTVVADDSDSVAADCEHVSGSTPENSGNDGGGSDGSGTTPADLTGPSLRLPAKVKLGRSHRVSARISCPAAESTGCLSVQVSLFDKGKRIGKGAVRSIQGGSSKTLKLKLKKVPRRVTIVATASDASGNRATAKRRARIAR